MEVYDNTAPAGVKLGGLQKGALLQLIDRKPMEPAGPFILVSDNMELAIENASLPPPPAVPQPWGTQARILDVRTGVIWKLHPSTKVLPLTEAAVVLNYVQRS